MSVAHIRLVHLCFALLLLLPGFMPLRARSQAEIPQVTTISEAKQAVVRLTACQQGVCSEGSGVLIDPNGIIATAWHVVAQTPDQADSAYFSAVDVYLTTSSVQAAVKRYRARVIAASPSLDLALLQITWDLERTRTVQLADALALPYLPLNNGELDVENTSEQLIIGYPALTNGRILHDNIRINENDATSYIAQENFTVGYSGGPAVVRDAAGHFVVVGIIINAIGDDNLLTRIRNINQLSTLQWQVDRQHAIYQAWANQAHLLAGRTPAGETHLQFTFMLHALALRNRTLQLRMQAYHAESLQPWQPLNSQLPRDDNGQFTLEKPLVIEQLVAIAAITGFELNVADLDVDPTSLAFDLTLVDERTGKILWLSQERYLPLLVDLLPSDISTPAGDPSPTPVVTPTPSPNPSPRPTITPTSSPTIMAIPAPVIAVSPQEALVNTPVTISGAGWPPGETVVVNVEFMRNDRSEKLPVAATNVEKDGRFTISFYVPEQADESDTPLLTVAVYGAIGGRVTASLSLSAATPTATDTPTATSSPPPTATRTPDLVAASNAFETAVAATLTAQATLTPTRDRVATAVAATLTAAAPPPTATPPPATPTNPPTPTPTPPPPTPTTSSVWVDPVIGATFVRVPAGNFLMGSTDAEIDQAVTMCLQFNSGDSCKRSSFEDEAPQHTLFLDEFWVMQTEVSNAHYRRFVEDGGYENSQWWTDAGWQWRSSLGITQPDFWDDPTWNRDNYPVVGVSWYESYAYGRWLAAKTGVDIRLPSEAQWEKAARGTNGCTWPWCGPWDGSRLNYCDVNCPEAWRDTSVNDGFAGTAPVDSYGARREPYGAWNMAGNVSEWVNSLYDVRDLNDTNPNNGVGDYPFNAQDGRENSGGAYRRVIRGGQWQIHNSSIRTPHRRGQDPRGNSGGDPRRRFTSGGFRLIAILR